MTNAEQCLLGILSLLRGQVSALRKEIQDTSISVSGALLITNNLSDLSNISTSRTNLGLGSIATKSTLLTSDIPDLSGTYLKKSNNLSDLNSASTARTNLGLGTLATQNGTVSGTNTGDETTATIKTKLGITVLSGSNTGDQDLSPYLQIANAATTYFPILGGSITGTAGAGFVGLIPQSSNPSTPASGVVLYARSTGAFSWKGTNGFQRTFVGTGITTDRDYILPDASGTLELSDNTATLTNKSISGSTNTLTSIPNSALSNNTISGIALGGTLGTLTFNSTNLTGTSYNGSAGVSLNTIQDIATSSSVQFTKLGIGTAPSSLIHLSGNTSFAVNFSTSGFGIRQDASTITSTTSSGTIASTGIHTIGIPTLAASSATTLTTASTFYVAGAPAAGSNVTISSAISIFVAAGICTFSGGFTTGNSTGSNLGTASGTASSSGAASTAAAALLIGGATISYNRVFIAGNASTAISANCAYSNLIVGSSPVSTASSGTHPVLANVAINPIGTITTGAGAITETAILYLNGAGTMPTAGTTNYGLHISGSTVTNKIEGKLIMGGVIRRNGYTVSTLPSGTVGDTAYVTDATAPTYGGALTGGGSVVVPVFYNGTAWVSA
jgi:hypothetical protein